MITGVKSSLQRDPTTLHSGVWAHQDNRINSTHKPGKCPADARLEPQGKEKKEDVYCWSSTLTLSHSILTTALSGIFESSFLICIERQFSLEKLLTKGTLG